MRLGRRVSILLVASLLAAAGCDPGAGSRVAGLWREAAARLGLGPAAEDDPATAVATADVEEDAPAPTPTAAPEVEPEPEDTAPGYWRYTEADGGVRFVGSLAEVPAAARASARRIETAAAAPSARPTRRAARPARPARLARAPLPDDPPPRASAEAGTVVVYTTSWCGWCRKTLAWLDARGVDYENRDIERNPAWAAELQRKTGRQSIPVVDVDGQIVRGFDPGTLERLL